jgi:hypothetical protein
MGVGRAPPFLTSVLDGGVVSFTFRPPYPRGNRPWYQLDVTDKYKSAELQNVYTAAQNRKFFHLSLHPETDAQYSPCITAVVPIIAPDSNTLHLFLALVFCLFCLAQRE